MWTYVFLFFILSPGILPSILRGYGLRAAFPVPIDAAAVAAVIYGLVLIALQAMDALPEAEPFQIRGTLGSQRSEARRRDKRGNPIRTCATDDDCKDNTTRKYCIGGVCKV
jgi:hypothetical protein